MKSSLKITDPDTVKRLEYESVRVLDGLAALMSVAASDKEFMLDGEDIANLGILLGWIADFHPSAE